MSNKKVSLSLVLGSLGVVYGDIGTSPLYAMRETLHDISLTTLDILGVLSLIVWSLILVISLKYLLIVFKADNDGEGGILALLALLKQKNTQHEWLFYLLAIFGAGLLLGDGMLTPAISVSSAMEGLKMISPRFEDLSRILAGIILLIIFSFQSKGLSKIGATFGPIILVWFITIALLGLYHILQNPIVFKAFNPWYGMAFLFNNGLKGFFLLGGVFLVVTGGEALYADIGGFGKNSIRYSWFLIVFPCLILNYFGQGAHLINHPEAIENPFYALAPDWLFFPLLILATFATIIASQAVISATFSLTKQAILLGLCPRLPVIQTSKEHSGQIYIPHMNTLLLIGTLTLIYTFANSSGLAHAYGIAVNLDMLMVTTLVSYAAFKVWNWSLARIFLVFVGFFIVDIAFLTANSYKFTTGGWVPVCFAMMIAMVMNSWSVGLRFLKNNFYTSKEETVNIVKQLKQTQVNQLPGLTGIFITDSYDTSGTSFLHFLKLSLAVPENILLVSYKVENKPRVKLDKRYSVECLDEKCYQLTLHYGFMDNISIPRALKHLNEVDLIPYEINIDAATYLVDMPNVIASRKQKTLLFFWQEKLFAFLMRNYSANLNIEFYRLPINRTIAIGSYCVI